MGSSCRELSFIKLTLREMGMSLRGTLLNVILRINLPLIEGNSSVEGQSFYIVYIFLDLQGYTSRNYPLDTRTMSKTLFTRPDTPKRNKREKEERGELKKTSAPIVFTPSTLEIVSDREKSQKLAKTDKMVRPVQYSAGIFLKLQ